MSSAAYITFLLCASVYGKSVVDGPQEALNLTPLLKSGQINNAKDLSAVDPTLFTGIKSHAGYFNVNETEEWNLFFWYFPAQGADLEVNETPLVIWLQGGPGGSSLYGLFTEIGPIEIVDGKVQKRPLNWNSNYSLLFIDNPVGTGFSYSDGGEYTTNEDMVGASLLSFLQQFLDVFTELRPAPLFLAGESYAGKYIPAFGHYIHTNKDSDKPINLRGLAIGDGWSDPPNMLHYSEWALEVGLIDQKQACLIHKYEDAARKFWEEGEYQDYESAAQTAYEALTNFAPVNIYNYLQDEAPLATEHEKFLNKPEVQSALHVKKQEYQSMSRIVYYYLYDDRYMTVKPWLEELLEHYGVMCYSGQLDVIVAYALSVHTYRKLQWSGAQKYLNAERRPLFESDDNEKINSFIKSYGNFWDVMVRGAGHMVPADKPRAAKQIIDLFINEFKDKSSA